MGFEEAYNKLGYQLASVRQHWSAEKPGGVCISIWKSEANWVPPPPYMDCFKRWPGELPDPSRPGHAKRIAHISRAVREFGGRVDVVLLSGVPGEGYTDAEPWERPQGDWWITKFDAASGKFRAEVKLHNKGA